MSDQPKPEPTHVSEPNQDPAAQPNLSTDTPAPHQPTEPESTIGTGTAMALGCVAATLLLIGFGLIFLFVSTLR